MPNNQNNQKKYASLSTLQTFLDNLKTTFSALSHKHKLSDLTDYKVDTSLSSTSTNPVQNKVLNEEFDAIATAMNALEAAIDTKSNASHNHDSRYYTQSQIDTKLSAKSDSTHNHDAKYDTKGSAAAVQTNLDEVSDTLKEHTDNTDIHVTTSNKSNWNSAYTHSTSAHARIDATKVEDSTTNGNIKINGTETNVYSHPNSGVTAGTYKSVTVNAQGHVTGGSNPTTLAGYGITDAETKTDASAKLTEAKSYADTAAAKVKNDLLNGAGSAYDTLKELGDLISENVDAIDALETVAAGKADKTHSHSIADVSGLQSALDGKAASSHGTHVSYSTTAPVMDGTASVGSASTVARSDHKHPTDTSRASKTEFDSHNSDTTKHITSTERTNWNAAKTHADSAHAPSNAEKNQNAFSNITVGSTTVSADTTTDTVTFVGSNVTITPDATNDKITFAVADGSTSGKGIVQLTNSTSSTSITTAATPNSVKSAYDLANTAKTNAATAQSKADSAYTLAESKVDSLSDLGITATATELNYVDGVTSNVQTQLDNKLPRNMIAYGTCSTAEDVAEKVVTTTNGNFQLVAGAIIHVNFTYANNVSFVKLAIDGNEAKSAKKYGSWTLEGGEWKKGQVVKFVYDGYSFYMEGGNTTIEAGGTGADNVEDARENLSVYSKEDHEWTLIYDSGAITSNVNAFSGISVAGYSNIAVAVKCVNTSGNSAARAGSIYISTQTGVKYQFPVLTNLFTTSASTSAGMAIFHRVGDYLVCPYAARNINASGFLKTSLGGTADNLTPTGGGIMRCISPISSVIVSSLDQNSSYYFGAGSQVLVWGWNA